MENKSKNKHLLYLIEARYFDFKISEYISINREFETKKKLNSFKKKIKKKHKKATFEEKTKTKWQVNSKKVTEFVVKAALLENGFVFEYKKIFSKRNRKEMKQEIDNLMERYPMIGIEVTKRKFREYSVF